MRRATLDALISARERRETIVRLVWMADGREEIVSSASEFMGDDAIATAIAEALTSSRARLVDHPDGRVFVHPFEPGRRLVIVGAVHIAQRLSVIARDLGYEVTIVDPRRGFLTEERFPSVNLVHDWPTEALDAHGLDEHCALVTLSHDPKIDEPALEMGLRSPCFYIGALGSRRTQAKRRERLIASGVEPRALERIHGPIGLDIGASSPAEIALSIAAEMTERLRKPR